MFIELNQNCIAKFDSNTPKEIKGFYTGGIENCLIFIFSNGEGTHLIAHIMERSEIAPLVNEITWLKSKIPHQNECYINIAYRQDFVTSVIGENIQLDHNKQGAILEYLDAIHAPSSSPAKVAFAKKHLEPLIEERDNQVKAKIAQIMQEIAHTHSDISTKARTLMPIVTEELSISFDELNKPYPDLNHNIPAKLHNRYSKINKAAVHLNARLTSTPTYPLNVEFNINQECLVELLPQCKSKYEEIKKISPATLEVIKQKVIETCPGFTLYPHIITDIATIVLSYFHEESRFNLIAVSHDMAIEPPAEEKSTNSQTNVLSEATVATSYQGGVASLVSGDIVPSSTPISPPTL